MVNFREEMRKEVEQYNWNRRKTEEEKERRHALHALLRLLRRRGQDQDCRKPHQ